MALYRSLEDALRGMGIGRQPTTPPLAHARALGQLNHPAAAEVLWLIVGAPEELEFLPSAPTKPDMSPIYPVDPKQLPRELAGVEWPPKS